MTHIQDLKGEADLVTSRGKRKFAFELELKVDVAEKENTPTLFTVCIEDLDDNPKGEPDITIDKNSEHTNTKEVANEVVALIRNLLESYRLESMQ